MDNRTIDYTTRDYEGFRNDMIELLKVKIPEYSDFSESDMGVVLIELLAHGLDILSYYNDKVANEIFPDTATERESIIKHCRRLGYELKNATPSRYYQVFKITPQPNTYVIPRGTKLLTKGDDPIEFELMEDLSIPPNCTGLEKDLVTGDYLYKAIVEQGSSVSSDIIGSSNGTAYQEFTLSYTPVILDSLKVYVSDSSSIEEWTKATNFIDSDLTSKQYTVETTDDDNVKIMFGSGISGMIPPVYDNGISASYRIGGGTIGNVALETITEMPSRPAVVIDTFNVEQLHIASDKENIEEAKIHAPMSLKTLWRAVCLEDYENLLIQQYPDEILHCKAIAEVDKCTISIYILTSKYGETLPEDVKAKYLEYLDERKEIGYTLNFYAPQFSMFDMTVNVTTTKAYTNAEVKSTVETYLNTVTSVGNFTFGEALKTSTFIRDLMNLPGVMDVAISTSGVVTPDNAHIIKLGTLTVNPQGGIS